MKNLILYPYRNALLKGVILAGIFSCTSLFRSASAQGPSSARELLMQLDSIRHSTSVARHFAAIYVETTDRAIHFFSGSTDSVRARTERFELNFAGYFLRAVQAYQTNQSPADGWKDYFADTSLSPLHYQLMGINAHINGDIWQALITGFTPAELKAYRPDYRRFQRSLNQQYRRLYEQVRPTHPLTKFLHSITLGLSKWYGQQRLVNWRTRQFRMAGLYYNNPSLFEIRRKAAAQKMKRINQLILRRL
ncbi:MAG: DUF5995 family protein [Bacteroidetes bacterium]|nr:DUF5995 family protein [Bacteroidota bacterium]